MVTWRVALHFGHRALSLPRENTQRYAAFNHACQITDACPWVGGALARAAGPDLNDVAGQSQSAFDHGRGGATPMGLRRRRCSKLAPTCGPFRGACGDATGRAIMLLIVFVSWFARPTASNTTESFVSCTDDMPCAKAGVGLTEEESDGAVLADMEEYGFHRYAHRPKCVICGFISCHLMVSVSGRQFLLYWGRENATRSPRHTDSISSKGKW